MFGFFKCLTRNRYVSALIKFVKYGLLMIIIPPIINYAALNREQAIMAEHGLPYDVGYGQKLFLSCKGQGLPTVVMDAPMGLNSDIWLPLQQMLSAITKVCVYDRAGLGMSERPLEPSPNKSDTAATTKAKLHRGQEFTIERFFDYNFSNIILLYLQYSILY
jgi:hypothetical protein